MLTRSLLARLFIHPATEKRNLLEVDSKNPGLTFYHLQIIGNSSQCVLMAEEGYSAEVRKRRKGDQVDQAGNNELAATTEALESAFANVSRTSVTDLGLRQLSELANEVGVSSFIGRIALAGKNSDGSFRVQFNVDGDGGFVSLWPEWAFELAKSALLSDKRIWVISNGDPLGANLLQVNLMAP